MSFVKNSLLVFLLGGCFFANSWVFEYKDKKESEINRLSAEQMNLKNEIDQNRDDYEKIIDNVTDQIEEFIKKASSENQIQ